MRVVCGLSTMCMHVYYMPSVMYIHTLYSLLKQYLLDQSDFLVVGVVGRQGVGKSSVMSLLAGSRTGSGKPAMFRPETKEVWESESYQTTGLDMAITPERVILLDTQVLYTYIHLHLIQHYVDIEVFAKKGTCRYIHVQVGANTIQILCLYASVIMLLSFL